MVCEPTRNDGLVHLQSRERLRLLRVDLRRHVQEHRWQRDLDSLGRWSDQLSDPRGRVRSRGSRRPDAVRRCRAGLREWRRRLLQPRWRRGLEPEPWVPARQLPGHGPGRLAARRPRRVRGLRYRRSLPDHRRRRRVAARERSLPRAGRSEPGVERVLDHRAPDCPRRPRGRLGGRGGWPLREQERRRQLELPRPPRSDGVPERRADECPRVFIRLPDDPPRRWLVVRPVPQLELGDDLCPRQRRATRLPDGRGTGGGWPRAGRPVRDAEGSRQLSFDRRRHHLGRDSRDPRRQHHGRLHRRRRSNRSLHGDRPADLVHHPGRLPDLQEHRWRRDVLGGHLCRVLSIHHLPGLSQRHAPRRSIHAAGEAALELRRRDPDLGRRRLDLDPLGFLVVDRSDGHRALRRHRLRCLQRCQQHRRRHPVALHERRGRADHVRRRAG